MNQKMRGTLSALVSASMVAGVGVGTVSAAFEDTQGHWGQAAIDRWKDHGIANGYENGPFRPDGAMTRAEVATLLADLLKGMPGHVNLIPLNEVEESPLKPSRRVAAFQKRLEQRGVTVTVRRKLGGDIDASCGQLRRKAMKEHQPQ